MNLGPESEYVEHKESTAEVDAACASIAAMLNKHGRGEVFFGVRDNGDVKGQDVSQQTLHKVTQRIEQRIEPRIVPTVEPLATDDGRTYVHVTFEGADGPYSCTGRYRVRVHDEDKAMTSAQVEEAFRARANRRDPWDARPSRKTVADVVPGTVERYVSGGRVRDRIPSPYTSDADVLEGIGALAGAGVLSNAGDILFCSGGSPFRLTMGLCAGNDRTNILDLRQEDGPVLSLVDRAEAFVVSNIRRRLVIGGGMVREEVPELPRAAIREGIVNAFCHRDWEDPSAVVVDVFMDTVEITNPGLFPEGKPPEAFIEGHVRPSRPRNPLVTSLMYKGGLIETYGSGIGRIRDACAEAGVRFEYRQELGCTCLVFHRPSPRGGAPERALGLPAHANEVLAYLRAHGSSSAAEISGALSLGKRQAQRVLKTLVEEGLVERSGSSVSTVYCVVSDESAS